MYSISTIYVGPKPKQKIYKASLCNSDIAHLRARSKPTFIKTFKATTKDFVELKLKEIKFDVILTSITKQLQSTSIHYQSIPKE